jgi:hypothetical protein
MPRLAWSGPMGRVAGCFAAAVATEAGARAKSQACRGAQRFQAGRGRSGEHPRHDRRGAVYLQQFVSSISIIPKLYSVWQ